MMMVSDLGVFHFKGLVYRPPPPATARGAVGAFGVAGRGGGKN